MTALRTDVEAGSGHVEALELGHRYGHLAPLATVAVALPESLTFQ